MLTLITLSKTVKSVRTLKVYFQSIVWGFEFNSMALVMNVSKSIFKDNPLGSLKKEQKTQTKTNQIKPKKQKNPDEYFRTVVSPQQ